MSNLSRSNLAIVLPSGGKVVSRSSTSPTRVRFGPYELDSKAGELRNGELRIVLQDQPYRILMMLIECSGEVLTREEIQTRLWPDVIVDFEHSINQAIRKLRCALNDSADDPKYIETVGRRGYRLLVPVLAVEEAFGPDPLSRRPVSEDRVARRIGGGGGTPYAAEDLKAITATLARVLQILTELESRPTTGRRRVRCPFNTRSLQYQR